MAGERQRLAHPAVVEVDERREVLERGSRRSSRRAERRIRAIVTRRRRRARRARPIVAAANGRSGCAAVSASSRTHAARRCLAATRE